MNILDFKDFSIAFQSVRPAEVKREDFVLIFLHEALGSIRQWRNFPELLCKELGLDGFVYDRQGHGSSSRLNSKRTKSYHFDHAWIELPMILEKIFPIDKKFILIGHSDGGTIALLFAAKFPKKLHAVITMAAHVINEPETRQGIFPAIEAYESGKLVGLKKYHGEKTDELFHAWADTWLSDELLDWDITSDISNVTVPILALQGENDQYGTELQLDRIRSSVKGPVVTEIIPSCGHHPHLEQTALTLEAMCKFLRAV